MLELRDSRRVFRRLMVRKEKNDKESEEGAPSSEYTIRCAVKRRVCLRSSSVALNSHMNGAYAAGTIST